MPVSPADFEFYSRMTGQPIPNTPAGRMAIAPQVYNMRRGGGGFGRMLAGAARGALAAGVLAGAGALALAVDDDKKVAKQQKATRRKGESFLQELQAQGAKEREATEYAQEMLAEDSKTYRGMVRDAGEKVIADLRAEGRPSASSEAAIPSDAQGFRPGAAVSTSTDASVYDDPNVLVEVTPEHRAKAEKFLANRISHQSAVPQADANTEFESRAAQIASTSEPTQPRVEVRQQPSSGAQVTDLSNVAAKDAAFAKEKKSRMAGSVFTTDVSGSEMVKSFALNPENPEYMGLNYVKTPGKTYDYSVTPTFGRALMSQMDRLSDPKQRELEESEIGSMGQMIDKMKKMGALVKKGQSAPELLSVPQKSSPFVTDGGKKVEGVMNQVANRKRQQRESELRDVIRKGGARLSPEKQEEAIQKMLTDEGL